MQKRRSKRILFLRSEDSSLFANLEKLLELTLKVYTGRGRVSDLKFKVDLAEFKVSCLKFKVDVDCL